MKDVSPQAQADWKAFREAYLHYIRLRMAFFEHWRPELVSVVRAGLSNQADARLAFDFFDCLTEDEKLSALPELLGLCSSGSYFHRAKPAIVALPRGPVLATVEQSAEETLQHGELLDWCNILDVYEKLDPELARRFAVRMKGHDDPEIQEWGRDHLRRLSSA